MQQRSFTGVLFFFACAKVTSAPVPIPAITLPAPEPPKSVGQPIAPPPEVLGEPYVPRDPHEAKVDECERNGGRWLHTDIVDECHHPTSDGGKPCKDRADCEVACVAPTITERKIRATGKCYGWDDLSATCLSHLEGGWAFPTLCVD